MQSLSFPNSFMQRRLFPPLVTPISLLHYLFSLLNLLRKHFVIFSSEYSAHLPFTLCLPPSSLLLNFSFLCFHYRHLTSSQKPFLSMNHFTFTHFLSLRISTVHLSTPSLKTLFSHLLLPCICYSLHSDALPFFLVHK